MVSLSVLNLDILAIEKKKIQGIYTSENFGLTFKTRRKRSVSLCQDFGDGLCPESGSEYDGKSGLAKSQEVTVKREQSAFTKTLSLLS